MQIMQLYATRHPEYLNISPVFGILYFVFCVLSLVSLPSSQPHDNPTPFNGLRDMSPSRNSIRLLTLDAFGTLYAPKESIGSQYVNVSCRHGLHAIQRDPAEVEEKFREGEP